MIAKRLGNLDFILYLKREEIPNNLKENQIIASAKIECAPQDPLKNKKMNLIYNSKRDRDCGLDCSEIISHFDRPLIPVYIANRGIENLVSGNFCGSAFLQYKLQIKLI